MAIVNEAAEKDAKGLEDRKTYASVCHPVRKILYADVTSAGENLPITGVHKNSLQGEPPTKTTSGNTNCLQVHSIRKQTLSLDVTPMPSGNVAPASSVAERNEEATAADCDDPLSATAVEAVLEDCLAALDKAASQVAVVVDGSPCCGLAAPHAASTCLLGASAAGGEGTFAQAATAALSLESRHDVRPAQLSSPEPAAAGAAASIGPEMNNLGLSVSGAAAHPLPVDDVMAAIAAVVEQLLVGAMTETHLGPGSQTAPKRGSPASGDAEHRQLACPALRRGSAALPRSAAEPGSVEGPQEKRPRVAARAAAKAWAAELAPEANGEEHRGAAEDGKGDQREQHGFSAALLDAAAKARIVFARVKGYPFWPVRSQLHNLNEGLWPI
jgi:uncharacterized protein YbbK (DUF523 family)